MRDSIYKPQVWWHAPLSGAIFGGFFGFCTWGLLEAIQPTGSLSKEALLYVGTVKMMGTFMAGMMAFGAGWLSSSSDYRASQMHIAQLAMDRIGRERDGLERLVRRTRSALQMSGVVTADPFNPAEQLILERLREDVDREVSILDGDVTAAQSIDDLRRAQIHADERS